MACNTYKGFTVCCGHSEAGIVARVPVKYVDKEDLLDGWEK